jgi:hypothetical protein
MRNVWETASNHPVATTVVDSSLQLREVVVACGLVDLLVLVDLEPPRDGDFTKTVSTRAVFRLAKSASGKAFKANASPKET